MGGKLAIALGGGAVRGIAHIGVLMELAELGVKPDIITGTSCGAFVGALYAAGLPPKVLSRQAEALRWRHLTRLTLSRQGPMDLAPLAAMVNRLVRGKTIQQLPRQLGVVAVNLNDASEVLLTEGDTGLAVQASCAIPGVFNAVQVGDRVLVDGGLLQDVPVRAARQLGADRVIAVSLHHRIAGFSGPANVVRTTMRSLDIMMHSRSILDTEDANIVLEPAVEDHSAMDLSHVDELVARGREAVRRSTVDLVRLAGN